MAETGKRYNKEFRDGVIRMIKENGQSVASVAKDLGISVQTIYRWLAEFVKVVVANSSKKY